MVQMVREGAESDYLPNSSDFMREVEVSRRTVARDLDFLRDEENAPLAYDKARHGYVLADKTVCQPARAVGLRPQVRHSFGKEMGLHRRALYAILYI